MFFVRSFLGFTVFQIVFYLCLQIAHNDLLIYAFSYIVHRFWEEDLRLEDEDFEEKCQIRKRILNDMIEDKCNASKCSIDGSAPGNLYIEAGF